MTHAHDLLAAAWALHWWIGGFYLACALLWAHERRQHATEADRDAVLHVVSPRQRGGGW